MLEAVCATDRAQGAGVRLAAARQEAGLSIRDLARAAGVSPQTVTSVELGQHAATVVVVRKLASALGMPIAHLGVYEGMPEGTLTERIRKARNYHGLTVKEAARFVGADPSQFCAWENGQKPIARSLAKLDLLLAILEE